MAVDLSTLVPSLRREVNPPGGSAFPDANDDEYLGNLRDAFWEARLDGLLAGYEENDGNVTPSSVSGNELTRDLQQLVVLYAGVKMIRNQLINLQTSFRAKAGEVEYEVQRSATLLKGILDELRLRRSLVLARLSDIGAVPDYYIDAVIERENSIDAGYSSWVG